MTDILAASVIIAIVGGAVVYVRKSRKNGIKCIGCPEGTCPSRNKGCDCTEKA